MIVTINTDASFNVKHQIGTFAFWIVSNEGRIQQSGVLRRTVSRPEIAEFKCVINAVHVLGSQRWAGIKKIIINTDCLNVIHLLNKDKKKIAKYHLASWGSNLVNQFYITLSKHHLTKAEIEFRHVQSHVEITSSKIFVNDWCDKAAKEMMRIELLRRNK
jgi:ribonuclease HI